VNKEILKIDIIILLFISSINPIVVGFNNTTSNKDINVNDYNFDIYQYPKYVAKEKFPEQFYKTNNILDNKNETEKQLNNNYKTKIHENVIKNSNQLLDGLMDSPWPMYGYDSRHTGRSPYSSSENPGLEKWRFKTEGWALSSPAIDNNGTIYFGSWHIYAVYPNGTLKWVYEWENMGHSGPAIDENGVIYAGVYSALFALNPDGTKKWHYPGGGYVDSAPVIDDDGIIYFAAGKSPPTGGHIFAIYPDGTLKWEYPTNHVMFSTPAIGLDGTIYCGSHDEYIYALYPNGTLRWKYKTGSWVHGSPTIADDGTVYCGSDDKYLYAFYQNNGTVKWKIQIGSIYGSLTLGKDGTIYTGVWDNNFYAINPDGTIKWSYYTGSVDIHIWGSSPALSDDETLYFCTCNLIDTGGIEIIALYTDGTIKWHKKLDSTFSSPAIDKDGTVYICSCDNDGCLVSYGLNEFSADANGPYYALINQPVQFKGEAYKGVKPYEWFWDFGDGHTSEEQNPMHAYTDAGKITVTLIVTDDEGNISNNYSWVQVQAANNPPNKPIIQGFQYPEPNYPYKYRFQTTDPEENPIWFYIDWGDGTNIGWLGPYHSGKEISIYHEWPDEKPYLLRAKAKDVFNEESEWTLYYINKARTKEVFDCQFLWFFKQFPLLNRLINITGFFSC